MKTRLVVGEHALLKDAQVIEVWDDDQFIATVYGADNRGVRVVSKYPLRVEVVEGVLNVVSVLLD